MCRGWLPPRGGGHTPGVLRVGGWWLWASGGRGADPRDIFEVQGTREVPRGGCSVSILGGFQEQTEDSPEQPGLTSWVTALSRRLEQRHPEVPSNLNFPMILRHSQTVPSSAEPFQSIQSVREEKSAYHSRQQFPDFFADQIPCW